jgi:hypothetical protein
LRKDLVGNKFPFGVYVARCNARRKTESSSSLGNNEQRSRAPIHTHPKRKVTPKQVLKIKETTFSGEA